MRSCSSFFGFLMESGKLKTLGRIGKVFYFVGYVVMMFSVVVVLYSVVLGRNWTMLLGLVTSLFYGALIMASGLLFQWLPQVSETLTKTLNNIERLNEDVGKLAQSPGGDASVKESDGEDSW